MLMRQKCLEPVRLVFCGEDLPTLSSLAELDQFFGIGHSTLHLPNRLPLK
jgi:hypothetical protein